jgi:hypothetical protein
MNYKKNLVLLLSLINITIVIFLLVKNEKKSENFNNCPPDNSSLTTQAFQQGPVCNDRVMTQAVTQPAQNVNNSEFILYFIIDGRPQACSLTERVNEIYIDRFLGRDFRTSHGVTVIKGSIEEFKNFVGNNLFKHPCKAFCERSPWILIRYPFKREFFPLVHTGNSINARVHGQPNSDISIHSLLINRDTIAFIENAKRSQPPEYNDGEPDIPFTDFTDPDKCPGIVANVNNLSEDIIIPPVN